MDSLHQMNWKWFLFSFEGRLTRKPFWIFILAISVLLDVSARLVPVLDRRTVGWAFFLVILWPLSAVLAKRSGGPASWLSLESDSRGR